MAGPYTYSSQTFSNGQVLTSDEMNQASDNISAVRTQNWGIGTPGNREAGIFFVTSNGYYRYLYYSTTQARGLQQVDPAGVGPTYYTGHMTIAKSSSILYQTASGTTATLIGTDPTSEHIFSTIPPEGLSFQTDVKTLFYIKGTNDVGSGGHGQMLATAGTMPRPTYAFAVTGGDGLRAGMYANSIEGILVLTSNLSADLRFDGSNFAIHKDTRTASLGSQGTQVAYNPSSALGTAAITRAGSYTALSINRLNAFGSLIQFDKDSTSAGYLYVSSADSHVYFGCHIGRPSQLAGSGATLPTRGTVMASADSPLVGWDGRPNWRLAQSVASCVPADPAVCGVFERPDSDSPRGFHVATAGEFMVRVVGPCNIGDLLESAGDGRARRQRDAVRRACTIGKVMTGAPSAARDEENLIAAQLMLG